MTSDNQEEIEEILQGKILYPSIHKITIWIENAEQYEQSWKLLIAQNAKHIYPAHGMPFKDSALKKNLRYIQKVKLYELR